MPILFFSSHTAINRTTQRGFPHFELNLVGLIKDSRRDVCYSSVRAKITGSTLCASLFIIVCGVERVT